MVKHYIYITHQQIFDSLPDEEKLKRQIETLNKVNSFAFLGVCNLLLSLFPNNVSVQELLVCNLISKDVLDLIKQKFGGESSTKRPIFHRQQLLTLIKQILIDSPGDGQNDPNSENPEIKDRAAKLLGELCLMINNVLVSREQEDRLQAKGQTEQAKEEVLDELFVQWLPVVELVNPPEIVNAIARTEKYFEIFEKESLDIIFSNKQNIDEHFFTTTRLSLKNYINLIYCTYAFYKIQDFEVYKNDPKNFNFYQSVIFANLEISESEIQGFFDLNAKDLSGIVNELQKSLTSGNLLTQYDFTVFRKYPLIKLTEDVFSCIDINFLLEKLAFGVYHTIFNSFNTLTQEGNKDRNLFSSHWGKTFEKYVDFLLSQVYPPSSGRLISFPYFQDKKNELEGFDGVIDGGNKLIVMEYKGGFLNATAKYSGNLESLLKDLDKKYGSQRKGGIEQLVRKIELVFNSELEKRKTIPELKPEHVRVVYPVLVVQEHSLQMGLAIKKLRQIFDQEIKKKKVSSLIFIRPLSVLSVEDLEILLPYIDKGHFSFTDILEEYATGKHEELEHFQGILGRFRKGRKIPVCRNEWIWSQHEKVIDSIRDLMVDNSNES